MSRVYRNLERFDVAIDHAKQALEIWQDGNYSHGEAVVQEDLGDIMIRVGRTDEAREHWRMALAIFDELGDPHADDIRDRLGS